MKHIFWDRIWGSQEEVREPKMEEDKVTLPTDPKNPTIITCTHPFISDKMKQLVVEKMR